MWEDEKRKFISHYCKKTFRGVFAQNRGSFLYEMISECLYDPKQGGPVYSQSINECLDEAILHSQDGNTEINHVFFTMR